MRIITKVVGVLVLCFIQLSNSEREAIEIANGQVDEPRVDKWSPSSVHCFFKGVTDAAQVKKKAVNGPGKLQLRHVKNISQKIFSACKKGSSEFDGCVKRAFNKLRPYFKKGIPEMGVAPFDPHFAKEVKQNRAIVGLSYSLTLSNVYEHGWSQSTVTKYKTDWDNQRIIYSQYFPEKWLNGDYEFKGDAFGLGVLRSGRWNLTLRDYSQTTRIKRNGSGLDVHVEVDRIGDMDVHVGNLLRGRSILEGMLDRIINASWKPGFAVIRPLINDLVSTAFTDIWSQSFRDFPIDNFIQD